MTEPHISPSVPISAHAVKMIQQEVAAEIAMQVESEEDLNQYFELATFNPMNQAQKFRNLKDLQTKNALPTEETEETSEVKILGVEQIGEAAESYEKKNYELSAKTLVILRSSLKSTDTVNDVLKKVRDIYTDAALADEALDFLQETADTQTEAVIRAAKEKFNAEFETEIKAGRNMGAQAREFAKEGLGSPTSLRDLYRDIIRNQREPLKLFDELTEKFRYQKLRSAITFLLHSLGSDLKAKGSSIPRGELKRLIDETRSLQGILGVFRFFQSRIKLIQREFASYGLMLPSRLDFEMIAKIFIKILAERYINPEKIIQTAKLLGISEEAAAKMIIYSQMRDAIKQIAPRYYRNLQHRDELLKAFIDVLEALEDEMEEEDEEK